MARPEMHSGLLIIGAGGHGKVVADAAQHQAVWKQIAFLDRDTSLTEVLGLPIVGSDPASSDLVSRFPDAAVAIGDPRLRLELLDQLARIGYRLPVIRHPSAVVSPHATIESGCVLLANSVVNPGSRLGRGCIVNTAASIDHDCELADGVHVAPGAHLAGGVRVGNSTWIGIGTSVREYLTIGSAVTVGAGAAVVADIPDGQLVAGVPASRDFKSKQGPEAR
jgi:sugar O-acyltransferase (sialic acid O-acetyltransferase NeuD family)